MNATYVTVVGRVATALERQEYERGVRVTFRVASTERRYDRAGGGWSDGGTIYLTVKCWRQLGENVQRSLRIGDPVIVHGRLVTRSFDRGGRRESVMEMAADAVGPDLRWSFAGVTRTKTTAAGAPTGVGAVEPGQRQPEAPVADEQAESSALTTDVAGVPAPRDGAGHGVSTVEGAVRA